MGQAFDHNYANAHAHTHKYMKEALSKSHKLGD